MVEKYQALEYVRNIPYTCAMSSIENIAKLTSKSQTTVPIAVRKALAVGPHDQISFTVLDGGRVEVRKVENSEQDPVVRRYLAFLEEDMMAHPEKLSVIQRDETMHKLLEGVETESFDLSD
jgi:antitoxin PrlF